MRQKLAICCGYLQQPKAILFDEPFTGLDPLAIRRLKESISERAAAGAAVMVSSHLLAMVEDLCTHFLMLAHGRPTFCGTRDELMNQHGADASLEEIFFSATSLSEEVSGELACEAGDVPDESSDTEAERPEAQIVSEVTRV